LIIASESGEVGKFDIVMADDISPMGGGLWRANSGIREADASVIQGALEGSNVDSMRAMVELIEASRYFEAYQKTMQTSDEMDAKLIQMGG
jgi:flagellar basal-body rod protein FlgF